MRIVMTCRPQVDERTLQATQGELAATRAELRDLTDAIGETRTDRQTRLSLLGWLLTDGMDQADRPCMHCGGWCRGGGCGE